MDQATTILLFLGIIGFLVWLVVGLKSSPLHQPGFEAWLAQLKAELDAPLDEYKVYTSGHPYTWTEVEFEDLLQEMRRELLSQWGRGGWIPQHKEFSTWYRIDNLNKRIYIVPFVGNFDENKLTHYEDYVG